MNTRPSGHTFNNSLAIRQEIQRFESVHPSIYAIYDLIELIPDGPVAQQIREHVVCIEDSFVNSQEWTLSRGVPDLRLGIVGSLSSGKSALVHRYLTGSYMQEESPEGGRFKKEIFVDSQSYLLLIRDEGGPPDVQFSAWVDAVIFVFSLESEASFNAIYTYYTQMAHFRNTPEIPLILVGTQDAISENNPRVIDESRGHKLAADLKRCSYYETCAIYGLNVDLVFQDACNRIVQQRLTTSTPCITPTNSRPSTPNTTSALPSLSSARHHPLSSAAVAPSPTSNGFASPVGTTSESPSHTQALIPRYGAASSPIRQVNTLSTAPSHPLRNQDSNKIERLPATGLRGGEPHEKWAATPLVTTEKWAAPHVTTDNNNVTAKFPPSSVFDNLPPPQAPKDKDLPTPSSTPTTSRKNRRRSNIFAPKKGDDKLKNGCELGSGRAIPLKQGILYKRSSKALNKEWKKKYVTLSDDGILTYHPSLHDYMENVHGKEISLQFVTVKVPGQKPRGSKTIIPNTSINPSGSTHLGNGSLTDGLASLSITGFLNKEKRMTDQVLLTGYDLIKESSGTRLTQMPANDESNHLNLVNGGDTKHETPNVKKRHRRMKSSGVKNTECDDSDGFEFLIVSLGNKQWHFDANNSEERDEWVTAIEQQILNSLQANEISKAKSRLTSCGDASSIQCLRTTVAGNGHCVDCDAPNPDWASVNLGVLMCIECSGIHRNLGSHISKVRSLDLDEWPLSHISVMQALGNSLANSVWEADKRGRAKPTPHSSREEKERWVRNKYEGKEFLPPADQGVPLGQQLIDGVCRSDMKLVILLLAHSTPELVNSCVSARDLRTPLHLACAMGNLATAQLLIWHNANTKAVDQSDHNALHYARLATVGEKNATGPSESALVQLLLANGCPEQTRGSPVTKSSFKVKLHTTLPIFDKLPSSDI